MTNWLCEVMGIGSAPEEGVKNVSAVTVEVQPGRVSVEVAAAASSSPDATCGARHAQSLSSL